MCIKRIPDEITSEEAWKLLEKKDEKSEPSEKDMKPEPSEEEKERNELADGFFGDLEDTGKNDKKAEQPEPSDTNLSEDQKAEQPEAPIEVPSSEDQKAEQPQAPIEVPSDTILDQDTQIVPVEKEKFICSKCQYTCERDPSQRENCCGKCNSKRAALSRHFGSWPIPQFDLFSQQQQINFWRIPSSKLRDLEFSLVQQATEISMKENSTSKQGEYLPLSVYAARGFPSQMILEHCKDYIEHDVLGRCYKVNNSLGHA